MNPIIESILIVLLIGVIVFAAGATVGLLWFAIQRDHEADAPRLDIPHDRDFSDPDVGCNVTLPPCTPITRASNTLSLPGRGKGEGPGSTFPHDEGYESTPAKRF